MRVIMVPVADRPESTTALQVATGIAQRIDANIVGCHLRPHRDKDEDYKMGLQIFGGARKDWLEQLHKRSTDTAAKRAGATFADITAQAGFKAAKRASLDGKSTAVWREQVGSPDKLMSIIGPLSDLTVLSRPTAKGNIARMFMLAALMRGTRPVLILPPRQTRAPGKRIAIAWNQGPEAAAVVAACMPLLQAAEQVTIISCGAESRLGPKSQHLKLYLRHYGVEADHIATRGRDEQGELLGAYKDSNSDVLMMGAYSRTRFREMVFGGMTQFMLNKATLPVIMKHS